MLKAIELTIVLTLLIFAFFAGVTYSGAIKDHASWIFEVDEEVAELPKIPSKSIIEVEIKDDVAFESLPTNTANNNPHPQEIE